MEMCFWNQLIGGQGETERGTNTNGKTCMAIKEI